MNNGSFDVVVFDNDKLYCPIVNGEPYLIVNPVVDKIGLNYSKAINSLRKGRLNKFLGYIQIKKGKNSYADGHISFQKNNEIYEFSIQKYSQWESFLNDTKGYKYVAIPVRKIAAWLYSIDISKVKETVRPVLEQYQDQCDEVLFNHFFGPIAKRKMALLRKAEIQRLKDVKLKELEDNMTFHEYQDLCAEEMRIGKDLKEIDNQFLAVQLKLF